MLLFKHRPRTLSQFESHRRCATDYDFVAAKCTFSRNIKVGFCLALAAGIATVRESRGGGSRSLFCRWSKSVFNYDDKACFRLALTTGVASHTRGAGDYDFVAAKSTLN